MNKNKRKRIEQCCTCPFEADVYVIMNYPHGGRGVEIYFCFQHYSSNLMEAWKWNIKSGKLLLEVTFLDNK